MCKNMRLPHKFVPEEEKEKELRVAKRYLRSVCYGDSFTFEEPKRKDWKETPLEMVVGAAYYLERGGNPRKVIRKVQEYFKMDRYFSSHDRESPEPPFKFSYFMFNLMEDGSSRKVGEMLS